MTIKEPNNFFKRDTVNLKLTQCFKDTATLEITKIDFQVYINSFALWFT
jgi:hypothetical protein